MMSTLLTLTIIFMLSGWCQGLFVHLHPNIDLQEANIDFAHRNGPVPENIQPTKGKPLDFAVCSMIVYEEHMPKFGHLNNGSRVEIQQDDEHSLVVKLAECEANHRPSCAVVDKDRFRLHVNAK
ncbi:hypothetical protein WR25_27174 [Diploscapter pachys]|uniref:Uncharacterized protein n=1 Tax=Diploscapter pachys TaxID=2018661 RepID=A0A2A2KNJ3_9BILA|nr:hypothetical protein WR25_27174 [Diploscapter pachys]